MVLAVLMRPFAVGWREAVSSVVPAHDPMSLDDVAYLNLVKLRTNSSAFGSALYDQFWETTSEQIELLSPSLIVALGVGTSKQLLRRYRGRARTYKVARGIGDSHLPAEGAADIERIAASEGAYPSHKASADSLAETERKSTFLGMRDTPMAEIFYARKSIELLNSLERRGFNDALYAQLHHFRKKFRNDTIKQHIAYCQRNPDREFPATGKNADLQRRLSFIHSEIEKKYEAGAIVDSEIFQRLVNAALKLYPL